jgi:ubiquitin-protein ligase E3 C
MNCLTSNFSDMSPVVVVLLMFASCFTHALIIADDSDLPLPQHQILRCILLFKRIVFCQCGTQAIKNHVDYEPSHLGTSTLSMMLRCLRELHDRSSRRPFCTPKLFTMEDLFDKEVQKCKSYEDYKSLLDIPIFRLAPYLVPFKRRLIIFKGLITANRIATQGDPSQNDVRPGIVVNVNRGRVLEDGLATMNKLGRNLRQRIVVRYYNNDGAEIGFDAGGLFKEFWIDLSNIAFNPNFGLFRMTDGSSDHVLYPNPSSKIIHGPDNLELFGFLGRILGKALYEGITIQPRFAHFFLSFLRGDYNYFHMLPDLSTMDSVL